MKDKVNSEGLVEFLNQKNKSDVKYRKDSIIERKEVIVNNIETVNEEEGTVECVISTQNPDRMGDIVISSGISTDEFKKIPSVYVNHDYSLLPVAKCEELTHKNGYVTAKIKFARDVEFADNIWKLVKSGVMRGISIGFDATEVVMKGTKTFDDICKELNLDSSTYAKTRRIITKWNLYEFSVVSIPANAECMVKSIESVESIEKPEDIEVASKVENFIDEAELKKDAEEINPSKVDEPVEEKEVEKPVEEEEKKEASIPEGVDEEEFEAGMVVESEHGLDSEATRKIVLDHLKEHSDYYSKLATLFKDVAEEIEEAEEEEDKEDKEEVEEEKAIEPVKPAPLRFIKVIKTPDETEEYIKKCVKARISGKTRI